MSDALKQEVGRRAAALVEDKMRLGIGTGSTAEAFIDALAERVRDGLRLRGVATSTRTERYCAARGIETVTLDEEPQLDLTIDGADEIDRNLDLIKGGGGALLREKIVAAASERMVVIADESKLVDALGAFPLPIEINEFGMRSTRIAIERAAASCGLSGDLVLRGDDDNGPFRTDGGHLILDASFGRIVEPEALADALKSVPGVVQHGLFTAMAHSVIVAGQAGVRTIERQDVR